MTSRRENLMPDFCNRKFPFVYTVAMISLARMGLDLNRVNLLAVGKHENYKGEILGQDPPPGTLLTPEIRITLRVGQDSAVDYMPFQFFYGLRGVRASSGKWEDDARAMMAPFDGAVIRHNAALKLEDLKVAFGSLDADHIKRFLDLFEFTPEDKRLELDELLAWATVFPSYHFWAGNPDLVCRVLQYLLGYEFEIRENVPMTFPIPEDCQYRLGSTADRLGRESILGKSFCEWDSGYEVQVKGIAPDEVADFLRGGKTRRRMEHALQTCMPGHLEYRIKVKTRPVNSPIGKEIGRNYLGLSSFVSSSLQENLQT